MAKCKLCKKPLWRRKKSDAFTALCRVKNGDWLDEIFHKRCWDKLKIDR